MTIYKKSSIINAENYRLWRISMDTMAGLKRTHYCGEVEGIGSTVVVGGYVQKIRDLGNLIFIDLRE